MGGEEYKMPAPAVIAGLFKVGEKLIDHWFPDETEANAKKAEFALMVQQGKMQELETMASVIKEEAKSEHFLVAAWRPITMLVLVFIIANNYIIYPYLSLFIDNAPMLDIPPDLWGVIKLGLSGYIAGRSGEKMVKLYKTNGEH